MNPSPQTGATHPDNVLRPLGLEEEGRVFRQTWHLTQESFTEDGLFFLKSAYVHEACDTLRVPGDMEGVLIQSLRQFSDCPPLRRLAWHCHSLLFRTPNPDCEQVNAWPMLSERVHHCAPMFYAHVLLSGLPTVRALHRDKGIDEAITADTLSDLFLWIREYRRLRGRWGFSEHGWIVRHFLGKLYKLGRLQFEMTHFAWGFHAFRHRHNAHTVVLAGDGMRFRVDGQFDGANDIHDSTGAWTADFSIDNGVIRGTPISSRGYAMSEPSALDAEEWEETLRDGDGVLAIHIDASGPMEHQACGESLRRAGRFFPAHFPEFGYKAFTCDSWLLDPQLERYLPEASNIVRFLREFYLLPLPKANDSQTFERVFDGPVEDIDNAPKKSSLQRAIIEHVSNGGHWRNGGGLLFEENLNWGSCVYRMPDSRDTP